MNLSTVKFYLKLGVLSILLTPKLVAAQVIPDDTLPTGSSVLNQGNTTLIEGGTVSGNSLFHSFEKFSIPSNNSAYFNNALDIQNIFSRVTGNSISEINGLIQANGTANVFLLNPNGIVFDSNAMLNIGGSFLASTADSINFDDGNQFSAKNPRSSLLTISVPIGLNLGSNPGSIQLKGTGHSLTLQNSIISPFTQSTRSKGLQVRAGKTLTLVGGEIELKGGLITTPGGRIELGAAENGLVNLNQVVNGWDLEYEGISSFKNVQLSLQSLLDASGSGNSSIHIQGAEVKFMDGSVALIQNRGPLPSETLKINSELLKVNGISSDGTIPSSIVSETLRSGDGANIDISTRVLSVEEGARISSRTYNVGSGGDIIINASEGVEANGFSLVNPQFFSNIVTATLGTSNGGNMKIITNQLDSKNGGSIGSFTFSSGKGGSLNINTNNISLDGVSSTLIPSSLFAITASEGQSGSVNIDTLKLELKNGSVISSSTLSSGKSGNIIINASDSIQLEGIKNSPRYNTSINSGTVSQSQFLQQLLQLPQKPTGNSGDITINARQLKIIGGANMLAVTSATGDGGNINLNVFNSIEVKDDSFIGVSSNGTGNAGSINIDTQKLELKDGGQLTAFALNSGDGGDLNINATDYIEIAGVTPNGEYFSGLYASSLKTGASGNLKISTRSLLLNNQGKIETTTVVGKGGNVRLQAKNLQLRNESKISVNALRGFSNGGDITINTDTLVALENSKITAGAFEGTGGNIQVNTQGLFLSSDSAINASSRFGIDGVVDIQTLDLEVENDLTLLPSNFLTSEQVVAGSCLARRNTSQSSFVVTGSGGLPLNPNSEIQEWENLSSSKTDRQEQEEPRNIIPTKLQVLPKSAAAKKWKLGDPIIEAQGIIKLAGGRVMLGMKPQTPESAESLICQN